uniref:Carboxylic ester hydrolase n=1 Tax=Panagrolaimus sp. JU765 TaxID=591449 RepID=A0AC34QC60_9BILA
MVFIHGGAFLTGHAGDFPVAGIVRNLVSRGVVVVTIQYRLGLLGFFTTRTPDFPANLGLLDQVEALKWVIEEIPNFGGNPYLITLFGQSAGSASVSAHLFSPISQSLNSFAANFTKFQIFSNRPSWNPGPF